VGYQDQLQELWRLTGYKPTEAELVIHLDQSRNKLIAGGERAGKSKTNAEELEGHWWVDNLPNKRPGLFWLLGDDYEACRGEWEHLALDFGKLEIIQELTKNIDPGLMVLKDGTRIVTKSAKYPEKIATTAPDAILLCEAAQLAYEIFLRSRGRLAEKRGWLSAAGTFEEEDYVGWYRELYELGQGFNLLELRSFSLPTWSNTVIFPLGRNDPELKKLEASMPKDRFRERFGGEPSPRADRTIPEFVNAYHVKECPFDRNTAVELAIDPGYHGAYAVEIVQKQGDGFAVIDEIYIQGHVTKDIIYICKKREWWEAVIGGAIDIAGTQHQGMASPTETWLTDAGVSLVSKKVNIEDGIELLRTHMKIHPETGKPTFYIDPKCRGLIAELGGGKSPVEGGGIWIRDKITGQPLAKNDHACKAVIYLLANKFGLPIKARRGQLPRFIGTPERQTYIKT